MFVNRIILRCSISKERCRFRATSLLYHRFWLLQVAAVIFFHELSGAVSRLWFPKRLAAQFLTLASPFSFASQPGDFFGGVSWLGDWSEDFRGAVRHLADEDIR